MPLAGVGTPLRSATYSQRSGVGLAPSIWWRRLHAPMTASHEPYAAPRTAPTSSTPPPLFDDPVAKPSSFYSAANANVDFDPNYYNRFLLHDFSDICLSKTNAIKKSLDLLLLH
ncbi:hypothetical protein GYH30_052499 [Glycine max]|nr:hypothetical protein GYH30_052499 [Glycine max]